MGWLYLVASIGCLAGGASVARFATETQLPVLNWVKRLHSIHKINIAFISANVLFIGRFLVETAVLQFFIVFLADGSASNGSADGYFIAGPGEPYITGYRIGTVCTNLAFIAGAARLVWWTTRARASSDSIAVPGPARFGVVSQVAIAMAALALGFFLALVSLLSFVAQQDYVFWVLG